MNENKLNLKRIPLKIAAGLLSSVLFCSVVSAAALSAQPFLSTVAQAAASETLAQVTGLTAVKKTATTLKLNFNAVEGADGYEIYDAAANTLLASCTTQNGASVLTKTITGLKAGETRQYKVRAYATVNGKKVYGAFSATYSKATAAPGQVTGLTAVKKTATTLKLNFNAVEGADGYEIYDAAANTLLASCTTQNGASVLTKTITGLKAGETRQYKVRAYATVNGKKVYGAFSATYTKATASAASVTLKSYTTTTAVNYRDAPSTKTGNVIGTLSSGTVVSVVSGYSTTADGYTWYKIKLNGSYYYVAATFLTEGTASTVVSSDSATVTKLKTLYLSGYSGGTWKSSDTSVATVSGGFVYGVKAGTAKITCTSGSKQMAWNVTVTAAAAVKLAYVSPNVASVGESVTFVAITDSSRNSVKFVVNGKSVVVTNYTTETAAATSNFAATKSRVWTYTTSFSTAGTYTAKIYSSTSTDGSNMSASYFTTDAFVVSTKNKTTSSFEERRISDEGLNVIASWEGYSAAVYLDPLTSTVVPTVGYGYTVSSGGTFYNNLTKSEAWALLCDAINKGNYTTQVNLFLTKNNIRANQCQFDAMVSFSYNCGAGYWNGTSTFTLRTYLLNAVNPKNVQAKIDGGATVEGTTSVKTPVYSTMVQTGTGDSTIAADTTVTIKKAVWDSTNKAAWYKVKAGSVTGYVPAPYVSIESYDFTVNFNYMDAITFGSELLKWNKAGGVPISGLVYRRLGEAKLFSFSDYDAAKNNSSEKGKNTYNYIIPSDVASKGWLS